MKKILCFCGLHNWLPEYNNIYYEDEIIYRTYDRCVWCRRWGKLLYFEKLLVKKKGIV